MTCLWFVTLFSLGTEDGSFDSFFPSTPCITDKVASGGPSEFSC